MATVRPKRVHPSGRLTFRKKVRAAKSHELPLHIAGDEALDWEGIVPAGAGTIECEIGCGKGSFLVEAARLRPDCFFVGVEAGPAYAEFSADRLRREGLANAVLVADDARLFLADTVPAGALSRLHVYYPDPWPKWRHRKRRLFGPEFPDLAARALAAGGELLLATDNLRYYGEALALLGASPRFARSRGRECAYGAESPGLAFGPTNFSRKYAIEGRTLSRAAFVRRPQEDRLATDPGQALLPFPDDGQGPWTRVADFAELEDGYGLARKLEGRELALFREGEAVHCFEDLCPHRGAPLSDGHLMHGEVVCPWHGWRYAAADGTCVTLPGSQGARRFECRRDGNGVWVRMQPTHPDA